MNKSHNMYMCLHLIVRYNNIKMQHNEKMRSKKHI